MQSGLSILLQGRRLDKFMQTVIFTQVYRWGHLHGTMQTGLSVLFMQSNDCSALYKHYANRIVLYVLFMRTKVGIHRQVRTLFTDNNRFYKDNNICTESCRWKIYMASCEHNCLCYLCRQMFARIVNIAQIYVDVDIWTRLRRPDCLFCSYRHMSALLCTESIKPISGAFSFLTVPIVLPPAWK